MAHFEGNLNDFLKFIGPRLRNIVQTSIVKKYKLSIGKCQNNDCGSPYNLEAAHVDGKGRKEIIKALYLEHLQAAKLIDLVAFEKQFIEQHKPLSDTFKILCRKCHQDYDRANKNITTQHPRNISDSGITNNSQLLPIQFYPENLPEFKKMLLKTTLATIRIFYQDGRFEDRVWKALRFRETSNLENNLRTRPQFRKGKWQELKIQRLEVHIINS